MSNLNIQGIQTQANRIKQNISNALQTLKGKGLLSISGSETSDDLPELIESLETVTTCYNGTAWEIAKPDVSVQSIEYGAGIWIASCNPGLYYSYDGINWLVLDNVAPGVNVKYLHDRFMVWGSGSWRYVTDPKQGLQTVTHCLAHDIPNLQDITYASGKWIAYTSNGKIVYSIDGIEFNHLASVEPLTGEAVSEQSIQSIDYYDGTWIMVSSDCVYYSTDVSTWYCCNNSQTGTKMLGRFGKPAYSGTRWVIVSMSGDGSNYTGLNIYHSLDGVTWCASNICSNSSSNKSNAATVVYHDGIFVAGGQSVQCPLYYSVDDGQTWTECTIDGTVNNGYVIFSNNGIQHLGNMWYARNTSTLKGHYSIDGINWTELPIYKNANIIIDQNPFMINSGLSMHIVGYNCGVYVGYAEYVITVDDGQSKQVQVMMYSYDGINWSPITNFYCNVPSSNCIDYHDGIWVLGLNNPSNSPEITTGLMYSACWR